MLDRALESEVPSETDAPDSVPPDTESAETDESVIEAEAADEQPDEPDVVRVSVMRAMPPDDSDLIVIVDEQMETESLDKLPARTHRREYRDLFTRLREN